MQRVEGLLANGISTRAPKFRLEQSRPGERTHLDTASQNHLVEWSSSRCRGDCVSSLQRIGVPCAPVEDAKGVSESYPELWAVGHLVSLRHPEMGQAVYNAPPIRRRDGVEPSLSRAPLIGEHANEILNDWLGMDTAEIDRLRNVGAIE